MNLLEIHSTFHLHAVLLPQQMTGILIMKNPGYRNKHIFWFPILFTNVASLCVNQIWLDQLVELLLK